MRDLRCALDQAMNVVLQQTVRIRHPFVLAQMFEPRLDKECLQKSAAVGDVFEDSPRVSAIPAPFMAEPLECGEECFPVLGTDAVFNRYHHRALIVSHVPGDERRRPGHRWREVDPQGGLQLPPPSQWDCQQRTGSRDEMSRGQPGRARDFPPEALPNVVVPKNTVM